MSIFLPVLLAMMPAAQEGPTAAPRATTSEHYSSILPYGDLAHFHIPYRFMPVIASLQAARGGDDNPREQLLEFASTIDPGDLSTPTVQSIGAMDWVDELALDWGTAEIGPGFLHPQGNGWPRRNGSPPRGGSDPSGQSLGPLATVLPADDTPGGSGDPPPSAVPEPASALAWIAAMAGVYVYQRRRQNKTATI